MEPKILRTSVLAWKRGVIRRGLTFLFLFGLVFGHAQDLILDTQKGKILRSQTPIFKNSTLKSPFLFKEKSVQEEGMVFLDLKKSVHKEILRAKSDYIEITIPVDERHKVELELNRVNILSPDFAMTTSGGKVDDSFHESTVFYRGKVKGISEGWAVVSVFDTQINITINGESGYYTLGKLTDSESYVFYNESRVVPAQQVNCNVDDEGIRSNLPRNPNQIGLRERLNACPIRIYFEVDYETYQYYRRDAQAASTAAMSLFADVAAIYNDIGIPLEISDIKVWETEDPYGDSRDYRATADNAGRVLQDFGANVQGKFDGRLAHLLTIDTAANFGGWGGWASVDVLCRESGNWGMTGVSSGYRTYPAFSLATSTLAHELGHNFGSLHTHRCIWGPNGNRPIDNCVAFEIPPPSDPDGPTPTCGDVINEDDEDHKGTIMSYCGGEGVLEFYSGGSSWDGPREVIYGNYLEALDNCLKEVTVYLDNDGDGCGGINAAMTVCADNIPDNAVLNNLDCDDTNEDVNPKAPEICGNGIDDNCNGVVDEPTLALSFDGDDDTLDFGSSAGSFGEGDFTIEMRIRTSARNHVILSKRPTCGPENSYWDIRITEEGFVAFESDGSTSNTNGTFVADGEWYHIAITRQNGTLKIYVDGQNPSESTSNLNFSNGADLVIGTHVCNQFGNRSFNGSIDELRFWNVSRSGEAINELQDASLPPNQQGLVGYYDFNNLSAKGGRPNLDQTTVVDRAGNNNGTLSGFELDGTNSNWVDEQGDGVTEDCEEDNDADDDGIENDDDNCPAAPNPNQEDFDGDGRGDACDEDDDNDGVNDEEDAFPFDETETKDSDGDGIGDNTDNCPNIANDDQTDSDNNGIGDACEGVTDADEDGVADDEDNCPAIANADQADFDGDGLGDACDEDDDNDGTNDEDDAFPFDPTETTDGDGDGIGDNADNCPITSNEDQADSDEDGIGDACEEPDANVCVRETQKLAASDRAANDFFGNSVAISGSYAIVGSANPEEASNGYTTLEPRTAYIFEQNDAGEWTEIQALSSSDLTQDDRFGISVAIAGDYAVVGADAKDDAGAVYVFRRSDDGSWQEVQKIIASDSAPSQAFGNSVAMLGDYIVVGAPADAQAGSAYIFKRTAGDSWEEVQKIAASDGGSNDFFGGQVAISEDYIVVAATANRTDANGGNSLFGAGAAYVFESNADGSWQEVQKIVAADREEVDAFGCSVSVFGEQIIVGADGEDEDVDGGSSILSSGSAYIFERSADGSWQQTQKIVASERALGAGFGNSVAMTEDYLVVGAMNDRKDANGRNSVSRAGAAYVFNRNSDGVWEEIQKIAAADRERGVQFGGSVAASGDFIMIGADGEDDDGDCKNAMERAGSAYIFEASCNTDEENIAWRSDGDEGLPAGIAASQNSIFTTNMKIFPNPSPGQTTIQYELEASTSVVLEVYDLNGRRMAQPVVSNVQEAGEYRVTLDGNDYSEGVYLVYLKTANKVISQRLVLMD